MTPEHKTAETHANKLHEQGMAIRKELGKLFNELIDEGTGGYSLTNYDKIVKTPIKTSLALIQETLKTEGIPSNTSKKVKSLVVDERFAQRVDNLFTNFVNILNKQEGIDTLGLNTEQQKLLDHMHTSYAHKIFQASGHASAINALLGMINSAFVPANGITLSASSAIRAVAGIGLSAIAQYDSSPHVFNAAGQRVYANPDLQPPNYSVVGKKAKEALYKEVAEKVNGLINTNEMSDTFINIALQESANSAKNLINFTHQEFRDENSFNNFFDKNE